jgi:hypothetical protein
MQGFYLEKYLGLIIISSDASHCRFSKEKEKKKKKEK